MAILVSCLAAEQRKMELETDGGHLPNMTNLSLEQQHESSSRPSTPQPPEPLRLSMQMSDAHLVTKDTTSYTLGLTADYALWYGNVEEMAVGLVVVTVKRGQAARQGEGQCLAYMGSFRELHANLPGLSSHILLTMVGYIAASIHDMRKKAGKKNTVVYGISTDACEFYFSRIGDDSKVMSNPEIQ